MTNINITLEIETSLSLSIIKEMIVAHSSSRANKATANLSLSLFLTIEEMMIEKLRKRSERETKFRRNSLKIKE